MKKRKSRKPDCEQPSPSTPAPPAAVVTPTDKPPTQAVVPLTELTQWHRGDRAQLLKITLDQLRTLLLLKRLGSPAQVAHQLGRDQSIVHSQLLTLNEYFEKITKEEVAVSQGRGQPYAFTQTGESLAEWAAGFFGDLDGLVSRCAQQTGLHLVIGATAFTVPLIGHVIHELRKKVHVDITVMPIRTREWWEVIRDRRVSLVLAAVITQDGHHQVPKELDMLPTGKPTPAALLTNLSEEYLPGTWLDERGLIGKTLILPERGIVDDLLQAVYGKELAKIRETQYKTTITDVYYGINLLRYGLARASMIALKSVAHWATAPQSTPTYQNAPAQVQLRHLELRGKFSRFLVSSGLFARKLDLQQCGESHPLKLFWELFRERVSGQAEGTVIR